MLRLALLAVLLLASPASAQAVERYEDADAGWAVKYLDGWTVSPGQDAYTTKFEAPADEQIDVFFENFTVMARKQEGPVTTQQAIETIKPMLEKLGAKLLEEEAGNVRLAGQDAVRLVWSFQFGGIELRMAQLVTTVYDTVYLCTFTVEASKQQQYERTAHGMFDSFEFVKAQQPNP